MHQGGFNCGYGVSDTAFCSVVVLSAGSVSLYRAGGEEYVIEEYNPVGTRLTNVLRIAALGNDVLVINGRGVSDGIGSQKITKSLCVDVSPRQGDHTWPHYVVAECDQNVLNSVRMDIPVCVFNSAGTCSYMLIIPTEDNVPVMKCDFETADIPGAFPRLNEDGSQIPPITTPGLPRARLIPREDCVFFPLARGAVQQAGLYRSVTAPLMGVFTTTMQLRRSGILIAAGISHRAERLLGTTSQYTVFVANHPTRHLNWLAAMHLDTRAMTLNLAAGLGVNTDVEIVHGCRVDDCTGCKTRAVQTLCYAAQQCTVANCIGTTVTLNKPLCSVGALLGDGMEHFLLQWRSGWNMLSIMLIQTIAVASTGKGSTESTSTGMDEMFTEQICQRT